MRGKNETLRSWKKRLAKRSVAMRRRPGASWRTRSVGRTMSLDVSSSKSALAHLAPEKFARTVVAENQIFDELVIDDWFHLEQMDDRLWWLNIGDRDLVLWIRIPKGGKSVEISVSERRPTVKGK